MFDAAGRSNGQEHLLTRVNRLSNEPETTALSNSPVFATVLIHLSYFSPRRRVRYTRGHIFFSQLCTPILRRGKRFLFLMQPYLQ